ncbi:hypothetical protein Q426_02185 [Streptococcus equi subsp. zooepidemicus CY]|nr:hypothetical protein Q426_02185 [Streptococcus equi subsp. zooepidemicus CY]
MLVLGVITLPIMSLLICKAASDQVLATQISSFLAVFLIFCPVFIKNNEFIKIAFSKNSL